MDTSDEMESKIQNSNEFAGETDEDEEENDDEEYDDDDEYEDLLNDFQMYDYDQQDDYDIDYSINKFNPDDVNLNYFGDYTEKYENLLLNQFEFKLKNPQHCKEHLKENFENFTKFINDHAHKDTHGEEWLLKCETLFSDSDQITGTMAYIKLNKHAMFNSLVNVLVDWAIECIDLYNDVYSNGPKYLYKKFNSYRRFKMGVYMCVLLVSGLDEATCELLLSRCQLQIKVLTFFDDKQVHTPIKLLLMKILDSSLYFSFGINNFLGKFFNFLKIRIYLSEF
jgi:hypothetical protein